MCTICAINRVSCNDLTSAGNGNVSYELQPELQNCITVQELELVTAANCQHSADVWVASQPLALSALAALTNDNKQCSVQQVIQITLLFYSAWLPLSPSRQGHWQKCFESARIV